MLLYGFAYECPYSSARFYSFGEIDGITVEDPTFLELGGDLNSRRNTYIEFLQNFEEEDEQKFNSLEEPAGNKDFIKRLLKMNGRFMPRIRGRPIKKRDSKIALQIKLNMIYSTL